MIAQPLAAYPELPAQPGDGAGELIPDPREAFPLTYPFRGRDGAVSNGDPAEPLTAA